MNNFDKKCKCKINKRVEINKKTCFANGEKRAYKTRGYRAKLGDLKKDGLSMRVAIKTF